MRMSLLAKFSGSDADDRIARFYSTDGHRMFDDRYLTSPIREYLQAEEHALARCLDHLFPHVTNLVEVGCGTTGRYLPWSTTTGLSYVGIDPVEWMVEVARRQAEIPHFGRRDSSFFVASCDQLPKMWTEGALGSDPSSNIVLFPFNLIGNLTNPTRSLESLAGCKTNVFVSSFDNGEDATQVRRKFYSEICGSTVELRQDTLGTLFSSSSGLQSYAYRREQLRSIFLDAGYFVAWEGAMTPIARGYALIARE